MTDLELIKKYIPENKQKEALKKLNTGYPIQYIIGNVYFYNSEILVNEDVLIPRFETEYLIEKTLKYIKNFNFIKPSILEIGTGSGCISIALKKEIECNIDAIDISNKAIEVAKRNANKNNVEINYFLVDIHNFNFNKQYDIVISNPPYVPYNSLVDEKIKYEPQNAIYAQEEGLYFYKIILKNIKNNLKENFLIAFEIGDKQGRKIEWLAKAILNNVYIKIEKDYNNYERYVFISNKEIFK